MILGEVSITIELLMQGEVSIHGNVMIPDEVSIAGEALMLGDISIPQPVMSIPCPHRDGKILKDLQDSENLKFFACAGVCLPQWP